MAREADRDEREVELRRLRHLIVRNLSPERYRYDMWITGPRRGDRMGDADGNDDELI